ncbi:MAG: methionyl-tRNA formyltransferase, partial [Sutterella sp.]|nr:methionyl-tRNA formyltransferase [Sutterella sp.]
KVWEAQAVTGTGTPGEVLSTEDGFIVACGRGALKMTVLQKPGKPRMPVASFLQSQPFHVGDIIR